MATLLQLDFRTSSAGMNPMRVCRLANFDRCLSRRQIAARPDWDWIYVACPYNLRSLSNAFAGEALRQMNKPPVAVVSTVAPSRIREST